MARKLVKLLEIKRGDWAKGLSMFSSYAYGGLFQSWVNASPFENLGYLQPTLSPTTIDATTITTQVDYFASSGNGSTTGYAFAIGNRTGDQPAKCFYRINLTDNTVTDYSTAIDQNQTTGDVVGRGLFWYGGRIIYRRTNELRSNTITPTAGNDVSILASDLSNGNLPMDFAVGPDNYLYYTAHNGSSTPSIGRIVTTTGTTSNTATAFSLEAGMIPRSLTNDGRYLVIMADNNDGKVANVTARCKVLFWDTIKTTADVIWEIPDRYLIGGRYVDGKVVILGASGIWVCSSGTPPKLVWTYPATSFLASGPNCIGVTGNIFYWAANAVGARVYAFGSLIAGQTPIVFSPYQSSQVSDLQTALLPIDTNIMVATDHPTVVRHNYTGASRASASVETCPNPLTQPYQIAFVKVVLQSEMTSGMAVAVSCYDAASNVILNLSTKSYTNFGGKKTLIFEGNKGNSANANQIFEDIAVLVNPQGGAVVERVTVYGWPIDDFAQIK